MLWHYQAIRCTTLPLERSRWPDGTDGHSYTPAVLELAHERLERAYCDEADFNRLPANEDLGAVPLLVRLQYMNECHSLNGAAAMALVRHAARRHLRWTVGGRPVREIGWRWGNAPEKATCLTITQAGEQTWAERKLETQIVHVCLSMVHQSIH